MQKYLITHGDLDGIGAAVLAKKAYPDLEFIFYAEYVTIDTYLLNFINEKKDARDIHLIITDICPSQSTCETLDKVHEQFHLQLFDHHKTRQWSEKYSWANFDLEKSGIKIFYDSLAKDEKIYSYEDFVNAIDAWDLWKLSSPYRIRGEKLNALFRFMQSSDFISMFLENPNADLIEPTKSILGYIEKEKENKIKRAVSNCQKITTFRRDSLGNTYLIVFTTDYVSEISHAILEHPDFQDLCYIVTYSPAAETCSLRTKNPNVDVSDIARRLGGGGHRNAAGFPYPIRSYLEDEIFKKIASIEY